MSLAGQARREYPVECRWKAGRQAGSLSYSPINFEMFMPWLTGFSKIIKFLFLNGQLRFLTPRIVFSPKAFVAFILICFLMSLPCIPIKIWILFCNLDRIFKKFSSSSMDGSVWFLTSRPHQPLLKSAKVMNGSSVWILNIILSFCPFVFRDARLPYSLLHWHVIL